MAEQAQVKSIREPKKRQLSSTLNNEKTSYHMLTVQGGMFRMTIYIRAYILSDGDLTQTRTVNDTCSGWVNPQKTFLNLYSRSLSLEVLASRVGIAVTAGVIMPLDTSPNAETFCRNPVFGPA